MTIKISVLIPTLNEEDNIVRCIESVRWADEVFVVDSYSSDRTVPEAKKLADKVVCHEFRDYSSQKNWAMKEVSHDWVLWLDADEKAQKGLEEELRAALLKATPEDVFILKRKNFFLGKQVLHGSWGRDEVIRVFNRKHSMFENIVHEKLSYTGIATRLKAGIDHDTFRSFSQFIPKLYSYSRMEAEKFRGQGRKAGILTIVLRPAHHFLKSYFLRLGFLDGIPGLVIAMTGSWSVFLKYAMLWEMNRKDLG